MEIDSRFDFRTDSNGKDPDFASRTLKNYHKILWSKELPSGDRLELSESPKFRYLVGTVKGNEFFLSSDTICNSYAKRESMKPLIRPHLPQVEEFRNYAYSIAGFVLFPGNKVDGKRTINQERGLLKTVEDRFDLTLEFIRLYYLNQDSPLYDTFKRYSDFFDLFGDFQGYVNFFLLNDLVSSDFSRIDFFLPFENKTSTSSLPRNSEEYLHFMNNAQNFLIKRNARIDNWCREFSGRN